MIGRLLGRLFGGILEGHKAMRRDQFEKLPTVNGSVLFLGDSITEGGMWQEWFPELPTLNRGIGGDTVSGIHGRLDSAVHKPAAISLLIGTNDLSGAGESPRPADIASRFEQLMRELRDQVPTAPILLNGVMPRTAKFAPRIQELNQRYREIAAVSNARYVDLWPALAGSEGELRPEFTTDSLHLNGSGYAAWAGELRPIFTELGLAEE